MKLSKRGRWLILVLVIGSLGIFYYLINNMSRISQPIETAQSSIKMDKSNKKQDVVISPVQLQTLGVRVDTVRYRKLDKIIRTIGRVDYNETLMTTISTKVNGWINKLYVDYTGKFVKINEPLYEIYSPEVVSTEEEYILALRGHKKASEQGSNKFQQNVVSLLESARTRLELWDVPEKHIKELEATRRIKKTMMIHSPSSGIVLTKNVLEGSYVKAGHELFIIADLSNVWVHADIYEYEIPLIALGQPAELSLSYYPGETFHGKVSYIYPYLEEKTRTVKIRFEFKNPKGKLKPGMFANAKLYTQIAESSLALPEEAVLNTGERQLIFIKKSEGVFEPREVKLGAKAEGYYMVLDGVSAGEIVATSANFLIDSESRLGAATMKMKM